MLHLDKIFSGKIRVRLLTRLLLNPESRVYLRGLEKEMGVSSNTVRLELNKLSEMKLIEAVDQTENSSTKTKRFKVNSRHPLFSSLRGIVLKYVGVEQIIEEIFDRLGNVEKVFLTGDHGYRGDKKINPNNTFGAFYGFDKKSVETISSVQDLGSLINSYY